MKLKSGLLGAVVLAVSGLASAQSYAPSDGATLRTLDKITGRFSDIEVDLNTPVRFGSLIVNMRACFRTPPEEPPESAAFLQIFTQQAEQETDAAPQVTEVSLSGDPLFSGWMFASSPGLSALEHPVYDVWVIKCNAPEPVNDIFPDEVLPSDDAPDDEAPEDAPAASPADVPSEDPPEEEN